MYLGEEEAFWALNTLMLDPKVSLIRKSASFIITIYFLVLVCDARPLHCWISQTHAISRSS